MANNRGLLGDSWAFTEALGEGVWDAGTGMVKGLGDLAKGGYELATEANARESAWETTKELADAAADYSKSVIENPGEAYRYARDGALAAYDRFEEAKDLAAAEGHSAEFFGDMAGGALFEVGSILVPVGLVAKAGKLGKVASVADDVADAAKVTKKIENAEEVFGATQKAKAASVNPVIKEFDDKVSPIQRCPVADVDVGRKKVEKQFDFNSTNTVKYTEFRESIEGLPDKDEQVDQAFQLFKKKKWEELEDLFEKNDINRGWPPNRGAISTVEVSLKQGDEIDRYGGFIDRDSGKFKDLGTFTSKIGEPFENRALPLDTLDKPYKKYVVIKKIPNVQTGKAIPWFGQHGEGIQYELPLSIDELITHEYIKEIK